MRNSSYYLDAQCGHSVQIGPIMQVSRLENEMACAIFELDWFTYVIDAGNNISAELLDTQESVITD